ncbi:16912_t:CDS:2, partial [Gigaspora margarita]
QRALNKYSESNLKHLSLISNAETSNDKTSSDTPAPNDISGDGQGSSSDTASNTQAPNEGSSSDTASNTQVSSEGSSSDPPAPSEGSNSNTAGSSQGSTSDTPAPIDNTSGKDSNTTIEYDSGSSSGVTGIDDIQIGKFTANKQTFGLANITADVFVQAEADGILGLGFDAQNSIDYGAPTLISTLIKQNKIDPIFSFHFSHFTNFDDQATFTLGGVDESKFTGKINYTPVIHPKSKDAIIDTGTTSMLVPENDAVAIHKNIPKSKFEKVIGVGVYTIPCNTTAVVSLKFRGVDYNISNSDLLASPFTDTLCISGIVPGQSDFWIVGQTFIKGVYSAFDVGNKKVGFALSK